MGYRATRRTSCCFSNRCAFPLTVRWCHLTATRRKIPRNLITGYREFWQWERKRLEKQRPTLHQHRRHRRRHTTGNINHTSACWENRSAPWEHCSETEERREIGATVARAIHHQSWYGKGPVWAVRHKREGGKKESKHHSSEGVCEENWGSS